MRDKNTSVRVCAKNAGGGAYLRDTTVDAEFKASMRLRNPRA